MLVHVDTLPGSKTEASARYWYHQRAVREDAAYVRGHVVGTLLVMPEYPITVRHGAGHERFQVTANRRISILAKDKRGAGMVNKDVNEPRVHTGIADPSPHLAGDVVGAAPLCRDIDLRLRPHVLYGNTLSGRWRQRHAVAQETPGVPPSLVYPSRNDANHFRLG